MRRYIFNNEYFKKEYEKDKKKITDKISSICETFAMVEDTFKAKRDRKRDFTEKDLNVFNRKSQGALLLLDTQRLFYKFLDNVNLDLTPNQKYVSFIMLCTYDEKANNWISLDELSERYSFNRKKTKDILNDSVIKVDSDGNTEKMFLKRAKRKEDEYLINLTAFIKYTNI